MDEHDRSIANGTNGYLADGTRLQVPVAHGGAVYLVQDCPDLSFSFSASRIKPGTLLQVRTRTLRRLHYLVPAGVLGPVEGDGSWFDDDLRVGDRIVTLWVEQGGAMWDRLHRPRDVRPHRDVGAAW